MSTKSNNVGHPPRKPINDEQKKQLYDLYYKEQNFFGRDKLFKLCEERGIDVSRRQLYDWLKNQNVHQLYRQPMKTKTIKSTILRKPMVQIGIDLLDMQHYEYDGYKYILTCIDLFSKKAFAIALKNKKDYTIANAMDTLLNSKMKGIRSIRSDNGSEFINKIFKDLLKKHNVKQILSTSHTPQSNGQIENFNKQLKRLIRMSMTATKKNDWPNYLQKLIDNYNNSVHSTTSYVPNVLHEQKDDHILKVIQERIKNKVLIKKEQDKPKYKKGDIVRIKIGIDDRDKLSQTFSNTLYKIKTVYHPRNSTTAPSFIVRELNNENIVHKNFYNNDLQLVENVDNEIIKDPNIYQISKLIQPVLKNNKEAYIVAWKGFRKRSDRTIEYRKNLLEDVSKLVHEFERLHTINWKLVEKY